MPGLGTIVNSLAIAVGSILGLFLKKGIPEKWQETIMQGIGFCVLIIGIQMALKTNNIIIVLFSLTLGAMLGEFIDIEAKINALGETLGRRFVKGEDGAGSFAEGFANTSIMYCSGAMAIVGSIQDGLVGDHSTLFAKATIDGLCSIIFTVNMGIGVLFSALSVGVYQGTITAMASLIEPYATTAILAELTATGGIMIMAIGTNVLKLTKVRIANLLPGILFSFILAKFFG